MVAAHIVGELDLEAIDLETQLVILAGRNVVQCYSIVSKFEAEVIVV